MNVAQRDRLFATLQNVIPSGTNEPYHLRMDPRPDLHTNSYASPTELSRTKPTPASLGIASLPMLGANSPFAHERAADISNVTIRSIIDSYRFALARELGRRTPEQWGDYFAAHGDPALIELLPRTVLHQSLSKFPVSERPLLFMAAATEAAYELVLRLAVEHVAQSVGEYYHTGTAFLASVLNDARKLTGYDRAEFHECLLPPEARIFESFSEAVSGERPLALFDFANMALKRLGLFAEAGLIDEHERRWHRISSRTFDDLVTDLDIAIPPVRNMMRIQAVRRAIEGIGPATSNPTIPSREDMIQAKLVMERYGEFLRAPGVTATANAVTPLTRHPEYVNMHAKREDLSVIHAYKFRGALYTMYRLMEVENRFRRFCACSTGNHALAILNAARILRPDSVRVAVPHGIPRIKETMLEERVREIAGLPAASGQGLVRAELLRLGSTFEETRTLLAEQTPDDEFSIPPFNHPYTIAGQATIGIEILDQLAPIVAANRFLRDIHIFSAIGGGGLLSGIVRAIDEFKGNRSEYDGVHFHVHGFQLVKEQLATTQFGKAIAVRDLPPDIERFLRQSGIHFHTTTDADMERGAAELAHELGRPVEGAAGATRGRYREIVERFGTNTRNSQFLFIISGGNA